MYAGSRTNCYAKKNKVNYTLQWICALITGYIIGICTHSYLSVHFWSTVRKVLEYMHVVVVVPNLPVPKYSTMW